MAVSKTRYPPTYGRDGMRLSAAPTTVKSWSGPKKQTPLLVAEALRDADGLNQIAFHVTGNPVFAWQEYARSRRHNQKLPAWVANYFDACAAGVDRLVKSPPHKGGVDDALARALQFKTARTRGRTNPFGESYRMYHAAALAARMVDHLVTDRNYLVTVAVKEVARDLGVSRSTVHAAYVRVTPYLRRPSTR